MPTYRVTLETGASSVIEVEADNEEDAIDAAHEQAPFVCAQCSGWGQQSGIELGDWMVSDADDAVEEIG